MVEITTPLPSIKDCQDFRKAINDGRIAIKKEPLQYMDFDDAEPGVSSNCLSARNLYTLAGYEVYPTTIAKVDGNGAIIFDTRIPEKILKVTDYFDNCELESPELMLLRRRMIEAGVVAP